MVSSQLILNPVTSNLKHPPTLLRSLTLSLRPTRLPSLITRLRLRNPMKLPSLSTKLPLRSTTRHPSLITRLQPNTTRLQLHTTRHPSLNIRLQPNITRLQLSTARHPSLNTRHQLIRTRKLLPQRILHPVTISGSSPTLRGSS